MGSGLGGGALLIFEVLKSLLEEVMLFCGELEPTEEKLAISLTIGDFFFLSLKKKKICRYKNKEELRKIFSFLNHQLQSSEKT